jgi:hypothetical protein
MKAPVDSVMRVCSEVGFECTEAEKKERPSAIKCSPLSWKGEIPSRAKPR